MNLEQYNLFKELESKGLKDEAKGALRIFIESFGSDKEKETWVWNNIESLHGHYYGRIRHEIFESLVFPCLIKGYKAGEARAAFWLGQLSQNFYQSQALHQQLNWITELQLYEKAYQAEPSNQVYKNSYVAALVYCLEHCFHEWPTGILYGNDGANSEELSEILNSVNQLEHLDLAKKYQQRCIQWREILNAELILES